MKSRIEKVFEKNKIYPTRKKYTREEVLKLLDKYESQLKSEILKIVKELEKEKNKIAKQGLYAKILM